MNISNENRRLTDSYGMDDNYRDVLSALSQLDDNADVDYVKENDSYERKCTSQHPGRKFLSLQNAAKFFQCLIQRKCA